MLENHTSVSDFQVYLKPKIIFNHSLSACLVFNVSLLPGSFFPLCFREQDCFQWFIHARYYQKVHFQSVAIVLDFDFQLEKVVAMNPKRKMKGTKCQPICPREKSRGR